MRKILLIFFIACLVPHPAAAQETGGLSLEVKVEGIEGDLLQNVLLTLGIEKRKENPYLTPGIIRRLHRSAPDEIRSALEPFGYYEPVIDADLQTEGMAWKATYVVKPGAPVRVAGISLTVTGSGKGTPQADQALKYFGVRKGEVFHHRVYEEGKRLMLNSLRQDGYLDARFAVREVAVDAGRGTADITLILDTGPRFLFGPVVFEQAFLSETYLQGFVSIEQGQPYTLAALLEMEKALTDTRQFSRVDVLAPRQEAVGQEVPVTIFLMPGPSQKFTVGAGYGTDTGARGRIGWEHRRVNRKVHRLRTDLLASEVRQEFTTRYIVPLRKPMTDHLDYSLGWFRERVEDVDSETYRLGTGLTRLRGKLQETLFLNFEQENFTAGDDTRTSLLLIPGVSWSRVVADDRMRTSRGYRGILELKGASRDLLSDTSFVQASLNLKGIASMKRDLRILARADLGTSWVEQFADLPSSQRFFAGGDRSVRGYAYKSLGPQDSTGEVVGGRHLAVGSVELELFLSANWSMAAFFDAGNSFDSLSEPFEQGAGAGIRWHTLIGPVRLDFASALTEEGRPWRIHLDIGPDL